MLETRRDDFALMKTEPLKPSASLLCKLASIAVHSDEMLSPNGHEFDRGALLGVLGDAEIKEWITSMTKMGMAPVKRKATP
jgi:hypothetical protein